MGHVQASTVEVTGTITDVTYRSADNRYHVIAVRCDCFPHPIAATSKHVPLWKGQSVTMTGRWVNDPKYGRQFASESTAASMPASEDGLRAYLASGLFARLGRKAADRIVTTFGPRTAEVIRDAPEKIAGLPGIGRKSAAAWSATWNEQNRNRQQDEVFLRGLKMTSSQIRALEEAFPEGGATVVARNPYVLTEAVRGIGFARADAIARELGLGEREDARVQAGLAEAMRQAQAERGHTCLPARELVRQARILLGLPAEAVEPALPAMAGGRLVALDVAGQPGYGLASLYFQERRIARAIKSRIGKAPPWKVKDAGSALAAANAHTGKPLSRSQEEAFRGLLEASVAIVTGGPGVGKTTLMKAVLHALRAGGLNQRLCALSARAAMNMIDATGLEAETIHAMLGRGSEGGFRYNADNKLDCNGIFVDEGSMNDVALMAAIVDALRPEAAIFIFGDIDQLDPIGPGCPMRDIIESGVVPVFRLTEIHRQAAGSKIILNAHRVNKGLMPEQPADGEDSDFMFIRTRSNEDIADRIVDLAARRIPQRFGLDPIRDIQVISPQGKNELGTRALIPPLQAALNGGGGDAVAWGGVSYRPGDKILHTKNNRDLGVRNGELGIVRAVDPARYQVVADYAGRLVRYEGPALDEATLGYATTIHKSQGSEYPAVIMPVTSSHQFMLRRRLIYTGMTRARRLVILVGQEDALARGIANNRDDQRHTQLRQLLLAA